MNLVKKLLTVFCKRKTVNTIIHYCPQCGDSMYTYKGKFICPFCGYNEKEK
jgi:rubrerythrin